MVGPSPLSNAFHQQRHTDYIDNDLGLAENGGVYPEHWIEENLEEEESKYVAWNEIYEPEHVESARSVSRFSSSTTKSSVKPPRSIWRKIRGRNETWAGSFKAVILSSWVNIFILVIPVLWTLHFLKMISHATSFACTLVLLALSSLLSSSSFVLS